MGVAPIMPQMALAGRSTVGLLLGRNLPLRPIRRFLLGFGLWHRFTGVVRYIVDVRIGMVGIGHDRPPVQ